MIGICETGRPQVKYELAPERVTLPVSLREELVALCVGALPRKAYGLIGGPSLAQPRTLYPCSRNLRNTPDWKGRFESFGDFYCDPDRGFVIGADEYLQVTRCMEARGEIPVGVFHSHRCRPAEPTEIDLALHSAPDLLSYIVSVVDPRNPDLQIYRLEGKPLRVPYELR